MIEAFQPISSTPAVPPSIDLILQQLGSALGTAVEAGANLVRAVISQAVKVLSNWCHLSISAWTAALPVNDTFLALKIHDSPA